MQKFDIEVFEGKIGYSFENRKLLTEALTHSSYANEKQLTRDCNERLEFLGDSILGVITAEYIFKFNTINFFFFHKNFSNIIKLI